MPRQRLRIAPLRVTVYLHHARDGALMLELERWHSGRRAVRLRELARLGLQTGLHEPLVPLAQPTGRAPARSIWHIDLNVRHTDTDQALFAAVRSTPNRSDCVRALATRGLQRETVAGKQVGVEALPSSVPDATAVVNQALREMMGALRNRG